MPLLCWERDEAAICAAIRARPTPLKIVLKTKNERRLLPGMIEHHLRIVGPDGLIVFDNGTTDAPTVRYLEDLSATVAVFRFEAFHNSMHHTGFNFAALYAALRDASRYYTILDTDERLYWFNADGTYIANEAAAERIAASGLDAVSGIWASNVVGFEHVVRFSLQDGWLRRGIRNGKTILSSAIEPPAYINHNWQVPVELFGPAPIGNAVIVHLKYLSAEQRLAANLEKLSSYSRCHDLLSDAGLTGEVTLEDALSVDMKRLIPTARAYVKEVRACHAAIESGLPLPDPDLAIPSLRLDNGRLRFVGQRERRRVLEFLADPAPVIIEALSTGEGPSGRIRPAPGGRQARAAARASSNDQS